MMMGNQYFLLRNEQAEAVVLGFLDFWSCWEKETVVDNKENSLDGDMMDKMMLKAIFRHYHTHTTRSLGGLQP